MTTPADHAATSDAAYAEALRRREEYARRDAHAEARDRIVAEMRAERREEEGGE